MAHVAAEQGGRNRIEDLADALDEEEERTLPPNVKAMVQEWKAKKKRAQEGEQALASVAWTMGPADLTLSQLIRMTVPKGFKYADAAGMNAFFEKSGKRPFDNGATYTFLGMVMATDESSWGRLVLLSLGHVDDGQAIDAEKALAELNEPRGQAAQALERLQHPGAPVVFPETITWILPPVVDPRRHTVAWARNGDPAQGETDTFNVVVLGKDQCLLLEFLDPPGSDAFADYEAKLQPLLESVTFLPGHAYADHRGPAGKVTLQQLVRGPRTEAELASEALLRLPDTGSSSQFPVYVAAKLVTAFSLCSVAFATWYRRRKRRGRSASEVGDKPASAARTVDDR